MIVFEEILPKYTWLIRFYLFINHSIYFFRVHPKCLDKDWFKKHLETGKLKKIQSQFQGYVEGFHFDLAFDQLHLFSKSLEKNSNISKIKALYQDERIENIFKKGLHKELSRYYYLNDVFHALQKRYPKQNILFFPSHNELLFKAAINDICNYYQHSNTSIQNVSFAWWIILFSYSRLFFNHCFIRLKTLAILFWILFQKAISPPWNLRTKSFLYAMMITVPSRQFLKKIEKIDFLIDGKQIKEKDVLFLSHQKLMRDQKNYLNTHSLTYVDNLESYLSWKDVMQTIVLGIKCVSSFEKNIFVLEAAIQSLYSFPLWNGFFKKINIQHLISVSDHGIQSVTRNILLNAYGGKSYHYMESSNYGCFFTKENDSSAPQCRNNVLSFSYYDVWLSWHPKIMTYLESLGNSFKKIENIGCLWSSHVKLLQDGTILSHLKEMALKHGYLAHQKIISVFDGSFHDYFFIVHEDIIAYLDGIQKLMNDLPDLFVLLKEKKARHLHQRNTVHHKLICDHLQKLENHPRCLTLKDHESATETVAASSLTICYPFSSPTFIALSARKKGLWYDPTQKFTNTFYTQVPGLVCHSYEALLNRVKELLYKDDKEFDHYLNTHIKGKVEYHLDSLALDRFRNILRGSS